MADSKLIRFYREAGKDGAARTISEVWKFDNDALENNHDFIQWLFPLPEKSRFNGQAPVLTPEDVTLFISDQQLRENVFTSFTVMMNFYGYKVEFDDGAVKLVPTERYKERTAKWITPGNHNFLRISRIIRFLGLVDQRELGNALFVVLQDLYKKHRSVIGNSFQYWETALRKSQPFE